MDNLSEDILPTPISKQRYFRGETDPMEAEEFTPLFIDAQTWELLKGNRIKFYDRDPDKHLEHNVICWECGENAARYFSRPDSHFKPCNKCSKIPVSRGRWELPEEDIEDDPDAQEVYGVKRAAQVANVTQATIQRWMHGYMKKNGTWAPPVLKEVQTRDLFGDGRTENYVFSKIELQTLGQKAAERRARLKMPPRIPDEE